MASVVNDPGGRRRISFKAGGKRRSLRLGAVPAAVAEDVAEKIGLLQAYLDAPQMMPAELVRWVATRPEKMYDALAAAGLVPPRKRKRSVGLGTFLEEYFAPAAREARDIDIVWAHAALPVEAFWEGG